MVAMDRPQEILKEGLHTLGISLSEEIQAKLLLFQENLLQTNQRLNLTSIKDPTQATIKHLLDSLSALALHALEPQGKETWLDLGTGGGLPGIPMALARPEITMGLVEATQKKAVFLTQCSLELGLGERIKVHNQRSETLARGTMRESIPVCLARGLGPLRVILELAVPFLEVGGVLVAYKGPRADEEL
jgi:16S rRNA (guanine527-N7)-methyltransferase